MAYEDTMDNHRPGERQSMSESSNFECALPKGRVETWAWIVYLRTALESMFGGQCPLLPGLQRYTEYLNEGVRFRNYGAKDWKALFWKLHIALRSFFSPTNRMDLSPTQDMADFLSIIRMGLSPNWAELGAEIRRS